MALVDNKLKALNRGNPANSTGLDVANAVNETIDEVIAQGTRVDTAEKNAQDVVKVSRANLIAQGLSGNYGFFVDGFSYTQSGDVGIDGNGVIWEYVGSNPLPFNVPAGTIPSNPDYEEVEFNNHNSLEGRSEADSHPASAISTSDSSDVQTKLTSLENDSKTDQDVKDLALQEIISQWGYIYKGTFTDGFTITDLGDVGVTDSGKVWEYVGPDPLPLVVSAGTVPSEPDWIAVKFNKLQNLVGLDERSNLDSVYSRIYQSVSDLKSSFVSPLENIGETVKTREYHIGSGRGGAEYEIVLTSSVSPNDKNIIQSTNEPLVSYKLKTDSVSINVAKFGLYLDASPDGLSGTDDSDGWKAILDFVADNPNESHHFTVHGRSLLPASRMSGISAIYPFEGGLALPSNLKLTFLNAGAWVLEPDLEYPHVCVPRAGASEIEINNAKILGNNAFTNGMVLAGIGGGVNKNIHYYKPKVYNIRSEIFISSNAVSQRQGGAAYVSELDLENGRITNPIAEGCTFHSRISPSHDVTSEIFITDMYAKDCESILNTTPSNFDNRQYALSAPYERITKSKTIITGVEFHNCGASTNARTQLSFQWLDTSGEDGGRDSGNYYPWAGIRKGSGTDTYRGLNWQPIAYNATHTEWSEAANYNNGDIVKVTNNSKLGGLFCFGRSGGVSISKVRGRNDHFSGAYPTIGAIFRGIMQNISISDVTVDVSCDAIYHLGTTPSTTYDLQPFMLCRFITANDIFNFGPTGKIVDTDMPYNGTWATSFNSTVAVNYQYNHESINIHGCGRGVTFSVVGTKLSDDAPLEAVTLDNGTRLRYRDDDSGVIRDGKFSDFQTGSFLNNNSAGERKIFDELESSKIFINRSLNVFITYGSGSPEGVVSAGISSTFHSDDGNIYKKTTTTDSSTGWNPI